MIDRRTAVLLVVAVGVALSGCNTTGGGGPPDAETVKEDAIAAMDETETYAVSLDEHRKVAAIRTVEADIQSEVVVDRTEKELRNNQTTSSAGRTVRVQSYVVNRTLYQHSDAFVRQYNNEWVRSDISENFSAKWAALDALERQERILNVSSVSLNGTETINGTEYYVLEANPDGDAIEGVIAELLGGPGTDLDESDMEVSNASFTYYVDTETNRPGRVTGELNTSYTVQGTTVALNQTFEFRYDYDTDVDVTLPEGADDAVPIGNGRVVADRPAAVVPHDARPATTPVTT